MWIIQDYNEDIKNLPVFYKRFSTENRVENCVLNISALGIFSIKINGKLIDDYFMPGWTNYNSYVHICSYDLTGLIKKDNLIEITLAGGWYSGRVGYTKRTRVYGDVKALFADIILKYENGEQKVISTDPTWRVGKSPIVRSSLFDGETVDFTTPVFNIDKLPFAKKYEQTAPKFEKYDYEPVKKICEIKPKIIFCEDNVIRLDFKQNFAGFISFTVKGERNTEIIVKHAEVVKEDGTFYYDNLRSAKATDRIILSGKKDKFSPKFTFHGFRYVEINIKGKAKISDIKGMVLSQDIKYGGEFNCSDEIVNVVFKNTLWGQKSNFISLPTDCPQRDERLGWTGDAEVFCNSAMFNSDCNRFFKNYLKLIRTDILPDGKIPSFVPFFIPVSASTAGVPGWADAICIIPYTHYLHYHDAEVIRQNLPFAVRHLDYYLKNCKDYLLKLENPFGDWLSVTVANDKEIINQCFLGLSSLLISKMFAIISDGDNAKKYSDIYEKARQAFRKNYLKEDGEIVGNSQTAYAFSLSVGYVSPEEIKDKFIQSIKAAGGKLTTGFIGVKYLLPAICAVGETDLAYKIIKETEYPSWGYAIKNGATTIWERWNGYTKEFGFETPGMNSFNHYSLGSCVEWLYSHVLGIKLSEKEEICISPSFSKELDYAKGSYNSCNGKIYVEWKYTGGEYRIKIKADKNVKFYHDFGDRKIVKIRKKGNLLNAIIKD